MSLSVVWIRQPSRNTCDHLHKRSGTRRSHVQESPSADPAYHSHPQACPGRHPARLRLRLGRRRKGPRRPPASTRRHPAGGGRDDSHRRQRRCLCRPRRRPLRAVARRAAPVRRAPEAGVRHDPRGRSRTNLLRRALRDHRGPGGGRPGHRGEAPSRDSRRGDGAGETDADCLRIPALGRPADRAAAHPPQAGDRVSRSAQ